MVVVVVAVAATIAPIVGVSCSIEPVVLQVLLVVQLSVASVGFAIPLSLPAFSVLVLLFSCVGV